MLNDVEYTTFKMFITQMSNHLFVISFQSMFYKTLRYRLARSLDDFYGQKECAVARLAINLKAYRTAGPVDANKYISSASLSAGCGHDAAGRGKHETVKYTNSKCPFIHQN